MGKSTYENSKAYEIAKFKNGNYRLIKDYGFYGLFGRYDSKGNLMWKECFNPLDTGMFKKAQVEKERKQYICKLHRG